ncbi:MAG TPA: hypothetical protein VER96_03510 [Polyangiaceae bacterium]|nr:hypothetical protein [Polyangiaceae bacterium]
MMLRSKIRRAALFAALTACFWASPARAESDAASRALAVQLFDEAEALLAKEEIARACPKYAESFRLDPQLGSLIYLAECYEKNGQLASAWGSYREAEEMAAKRGDERQTHAHERAEALAPRLSRLVVNVPAEARLRGLEVLRDGVPVAPTLWGSGAAIDTGKHRIEARAPGYKPWQIDLDVAGEGSSTSVTVPKLALDPNARVAVGGDNVGQSQRIAAIAVGGVGIVGLGVGGFFGLSAQSTYSDSKSLCNDQDVCTEQGKELRDSAKNKALAATVAGGVSVAALATAAVLWFTAPKAERPKDTAARRGIHWAFGPNARAWGMELNGEF